jgi:CRP/FNR family transcriptional regulator
MFCDLAEKDLAELTKARTPNVYRKRSVIFYEGNPCLGVFCVFSGKVKISNRGADGHKQIVRLAKDGDLLGYRALLAGEAYAATAEVIEKATICFLDKQVFLQMIRRKPDVAGRIMKRICQDLRRAEQHALDLIQKPVAQRVGVLLLDLQERFGEKTERGVRINLELTRGEMAEMIGTTPESLIRILSDFKRRRLVDTDGPHVFVRNAAEIARLISG